MRFDRHLLLLLLGMSAGLAPVAAGTARAGATNPTLAIGHVAARAAGPAAVVEVTGTWDFDDVLQVDFPVSLVVYQGTSFVRYPVGAPPEAGSFAGLADGLDTGEIAALEAAGAPEPTAELLRLEPKRTLVALPPSFTDGTVSVVAYVELPSEGSFVSNTLSTTLVGTGGGN